MQTVEFEKWKILSDPELTREVYAGIETSGAELCGCEECFNFAAARHLAYDAETLDLFEWLGIDPLLESAVRHLERTASGLHRYSGWFHLVGEIEGGPVTPVAAGAEGGELVSLVRSGDGLLIGFSVVRDTAPEGFRGLPVVALEFCADVPWISNGPEPR